MTVWQSITSLLIRPVVSLPLFILLVLMPLSAGEESGGWNYRRNISGIKIYQRDRQIPGIHEFLAVTVINSPPAKIAAIVLDINSNSRWMSDCVLSLPLQRLDSGDIIAYYVTVPPWPAAMRDSVVRISKAYSKGGIFFTMSSLPEGIAESYRPINTECVRIYRMEGSVTLKSRTSGSTEIHFSVSGDPGGYVPGFIIDLGGWMIPYKTLTGLKRFAGELSTEK